MLYPTAMVGKVGHLVKWGSGKHSLPRFFCGTPPPRFTFTVTSLPADEACKDLCPVCQNEVRRLDHFWRIVKREEAERNGG